MPHELLAELDGERARLEAATPGLQVTLADAVRVLLREALDARARKGGRK